MYLTGKKQSVSRNAHVEKVTFQTGKSNHWSVVAPSSFTRLVQQWTASQHEWISCGASFWWTEGEHIVVSHVNSWLVLGVINQRKWLFETLRVSCSPHEFCKHGYSPFAPTGMASAVAMMGRWADPL